jgi:hypothetical protein
MVRCHGDKLNHPSLVHDDFVRKNKSRVDDYIILNYLLLITHLKIITVRDQFRESMKKNRQKPAAGFNPLHG